MPVCVGTPLEAGPNDLKVFWFYSLLDPIINERVSVNAPDPVLAKYFPVVMAFFTEGWPALLEEDVQIFTNLDRVKPCNWSLTTSSCHDSVVL